MLLFSVNSIIVMGCSLVWSSYLKSTTIPELSCTCADKDQRAGTHCNSFKVSAIGEVSCVCVLTCYVSLPLL